MKNEEFSLAKRIIPCLDIKDGKTVKGVNFVNFRDAGDPVELGAAYSRAGADELVYLDITASHEGRKTFTELVRQVAAHICIPFTVGGGIHELQDVDRLLNAGADKVSINSAAIRNPKLIDEIAGHFGSQVCVVAIDANQEGEDWILAARPVDGICSAVVETYDDHRMAMSLALAAASGAEVTVLDPGCTAKTFPTYFELLESLCRHEGG